MPNCESYTIVPGGLRYAVTPSYSGLTYFNSSHGPITGSRHVISYSRALPLTGSSLDRQTWIADLRRYWQPFRRNTVAVRLMGASSSGENPRAFVIGGPWTLRGFNFYDYQTVPNLSGRHLAVANFEYRIPLVDYLIFGWPARWGLTDIGATLFFDAGAAWNDKVRLTRRDETGSLAFADLRGDYGFGLRANFFFLPLKFDWAWRTDLHYAYERVFQFSIGPEF